MSWPVTINGVTYQASDFSPYGYVTNFPAIFNDFATVAAAMEALAAGTAGETTVASAATTDIGTPSTFKIAVSGSVTITSLSTAVNRVRLVRFTGAPLLTHNATTLILPGGVNRQAAAGDAALFSSDSSGNWRCVSYLDGPLRGQYPFPATQNASADANTLDDYEEGTWTPSLGGDTTYNVQAGRYTKVGRCVHLEYDIHVNAIGTGSASTISGLPFVCNGTIAGTGAVSFWSSLATAPASVVAYIAPSAATMQFTGVTAGNATIATHSLFGNSARVIGAADFTV